MARIHTLLLLLGAFACLVSAAGQTFCKCTCFKNSTIIPLGPESEAIDQSSSSSSRSLDSRSSTSFLRSILSQASTPGRATPAHQHTRRTASSSCSSCTKAFCLSQGIDFCKEAEEDDVVTMCFQRDSNKDRIIVWAFIVGTVGLLGWAGFKKMLEWRDGRGSLGGGGAARSHYSAVRR